MINLEETKPRQILGDVEQLTRGAMRIPEVLESMGFSELREGQAEPVYSLMSGLDTLVVLPTSLGKSLVFTLPVLCLDWKAVVFSPLTALMQDQVKSLHRKGVKAAQMSGLQTEAENAAALQAWQAGNIQMLYIAPERLDNEAFRQAMKNVRPDMVIVDEAHVCSQWSDNFRHHYVTIGDFVEEFQPKVVCACTATCPKEVETDLRRVLRMQHAKLWKFMPRRHNLHLSSATFSGYPDLARRCEAVGGPCLIYCATQKEVENCTIQMQNLLPSDDLVIPFHGGMPVATKNANLHMFMNGKARVVVCTNAFGMGVDKAQPLWEKVLTPEGWVSMGDLNVGDAVVGSDGKPTVVVATHDHGTRPCAEVSFNDGSVVTCSLQHRWSVRSPKEAYRGQPFKILTTDQIRNSLVDTSGNSKHFVPSVMPIQYSKNKLPIHPYVLGVLLGDGSITQAVKFISADKEIVGSVDRYTPATCKVKAYGKYEYGVVHGKGKKNPVWEALKRLNMAGCKAQTKFIPEMYLYSDISDRIELLRGLMDTDGHAVAGRSSAVYVTTSDILKDNVRELVQSLGGRVNVKRKVEAWYLYCTVSDIVPFSLRRKVEVYTTPTKYLPKRCIKSVKEVEPQTVRCITVQNPDGLYITSNFIVTHNSDIRGVIHRHFPGSPEALSQELGRAGRDGKDSFCTTLYDPDAQRTQEYFFRMGNPDEADIRRVFKALQNESGNGKRPVRLTMNNIASRAGVQAELLQSILQILTGSGCITRASDPEKIAKIKLAKDPFDDARLKTYSEVLYRTSQMDKDGYRDISLDFLAAELGLTRATIQRHLKQFQEDNKIEYVPPYNGSVTMVVGSLDLVDFPRLAEKKRRERDKLDKVLEYLNTPDEDKHDWLDQYFEV